MSKTGTKKNHPEGCKCLECAPVPKFGKNWWNRKGPRNSPNLSIERLMKITGLKPNEESGTQ